MVQELLVFPVARTVGIWTLIGSEEPLQFRPKEASWTAGSSKIYIIFPETWRTRCTQSLCGADMLTCFLQKVLARYRSFLFRMRIDVTLIRHLFSWVSVCHASTRNFEGHIRWFQVWLSVRARMWRCWLYAFLYLGQVIFGGIVQPFPQRGFCMSLWHPRFMRRTCLLKAASTKLQLGPLPALGYWEAKLVIKKSRFVARLGAAASLEDAKDFRSGGGWATR